MPLYVSSPVDGVTTVAMATVVVTVVDPIIYIIISSSTVELVIVGMT